MTYSHTLLIVEDDKDSCEMLLLIVRKLFPGLDAHSAGNGVLGWELYQRYNPDIVVTDLNMPGLDGLQLACMIRAANPQTKLVALSADIERAVLESPPANRLLFDHVILKPFKFSALSAAIEDILPTAGKAAEVATE
jgi:CheY-like chemotaxis protein